MRDWIGRIVQIVLAIIGLHIWLAPGFAWRLAGGLTLVYPRPEVGLLLILLGAGVRLLISAAHRTRVRALTAADRRVVREYAAGGPRVPWRAAFFWVFLPTLLIYASNSRTIGSGDTAPMLEVALSVLHEADLDLDEFVSADDPPYYATRIGEHWYSRFSLGPAFVALPVVAVSELVGGAPAEPLHRWRLEKIIAAMIAALTAAAVFLCLLRGCPPGPAVVLTIFFALGTQNWSIASQALWQHGAAGAAVALALGRIKNGESRIQNDRLADGGGAATWQRCSLGWFVIGLLLALAVACRPTVGVLLGLFILLAAREGVRGVAAYSAGAAFILGPLVGLHLSVYGSVLGPYAHTAAEAKWGANLADSIPGNLISPGRGLFIYQPLLALAALAVLPAGRRMLGGRLVGVLLAWAGLHLLVVSSYTHWWGGHAWGPRFFTELMPALVLLAAPGVVWLWRYRAGRALVVLLIAWSIGLQALGVYSPHAQRWMRTPQDIDVAPQRLWDWQDPPFLYPWRDGAG